MTGSLLLQVEHFGEMMQALSYIET